MFPDGSIESSPLTPSATTRFPLVSKSSPSGRPPVSAKTSGSELPGAAPTYRVTSFSHDGAFTPGDRGGDVAGVNPDAPFTPLPGRPD